MSIYGCLHPRMPGVFPIVIALVALLVPRGAAAVDLAEQPAALLPGAAPEEWELGGPVYGSSSYHDNRFQGTRIDQFQVRNYLLHGIAALEPARLSVFYATAMFNGPVNPGDTPGAGAALWMMNAVQFEYGFLLTVDLPTASSPRLDRLALLSEFSRRSYHPLRSSGFAEPAADLLRIGVVARGLRSGPVVWDIAMRLGWSELYDFWDAPSLPDPRARYTAHLALDGTWRPWSVRPLALFGTIMPDLILLRDGGGDIDLTAELGVRAGTGPGRLELFLDAYRSGDTEQLEDEQAPATLLGFGVRFVIEA